MSSFRPSNVQEFLQYSDLSKYVTLLEGQGYRTIGDMFLLSEEDLDSVHITNKDERLAILSAVDKIGISSWLGYHGLHFYEHLFKAHKIQTVGELKRTNMTEDLMDELEVMVPGDRKRLSMAASHICTTLFEEDSVAIATAQAVSTYEGESQAVGYWGKNDAMPTKNNVIWVNCKIKSNIPGEDDERLLCMVDSGSEVVTCEEHIVTKLGLEYIKTIDSKGIHNIEKKSLFKGTLVLGNKELEVEIMPDSYNSVGCNVIEKFSHFIDQNRHIWFG